MRFAQVFFLIFVVGCDVQVTDIQDIEINEYELAEENQKLVKALIYYDYRYIASNVPSMNAEVAKGLRLGYFVRSSDGKPSYRITYRLDNPAVAASHRQLNKEFAEFIPKLAKTHVNKSADFRTLEPIALDWILAMLSGDDTLYPQMHQVVRNWISKQDFNTIQEALQAESLSEFQFVIGQFYEAFDDFPAGYALYFSAKSETAKDPVIKVGLSPEGEGWVVSGFGVIRNFQPL